MSSHSPRQGSRRLRRPGRRGILVSLTSIALAALALVLFATPWLVEGVSMAATLRSGEVVLVERTALTDLARGDVIVFNPPIPGYSGEPYVKRVIGLPGDTVTIQDGSVYVNGAKLAEPYLTAGEITLPDARATSADAAESFTVMVPAGTVFVLGDNRTLSYDSRAYGPVPLASVVGRAWLALDAGKPVLTGL